MSSPPLGDEYEPPDEPDLEYLLQRLEELEEIVDQPEERRHVRRTMNVARRIPGSEMIEKRIQKYTTTDLAETFVGGVILSLPLLVEDGVFDIATWFAENTVAGIPVFLLGNIAFVVALTVGLIYWADIRHVRITEPIFGFIPRRLVGVLVISFLTATMLVVLWGRHVEGDPASTLEILGRITVIWAAAAFGGAMGDILPGEGTGTDLTVENISGVVRGEA